MAAIDDVIELDKPASTAKRRMTKAEADRKGAPKAEAVAASQRLDSQPTMKRVLLTSPKGGCGKTELTKNLVLLCHKFLTGDRTATPVTCCC